MKEKKDSVELDAQDLSEYRGEDQCLILKAELVPEFPALRIEIPQHRKLLENECHHFQNGTQSTMNQNMHSEYPNHQHWEALILLDHGCLVL